MTVTGTFVQRTKHVTRQRKNITMPNRNTWLVLRPRDDTFLLAQYFNKPKIKRPEYNKEIKNGDNYSRLCNQFRFISIRGKLYEAVSVTDDSHHNEKITFM